jgi:branched-chain amino acid transport system substrate-binding protein
LNGPVDLLVEDRKTGQEGGLTMRARMWLVAGAAIGVLVGFHAPMAPAGERGPIKIGYHAPLSGPGAGPGKDMTDGFMLFWEEVGSQAAGRKVEVILEDDENVPATVLTKFRRLVEQAKVHTVAGGLLAAGGYAVVPYVEQQKIPTIFPVTAPDDITQRKVSRWVVRTGHAGSQATHPMGDYAYKVMGLRRVAAIGFDYSFGWEGVGGFQHVFEELGGKVVQRIYTPLNVQDFGPYLASLKRDVDGVFLNYSASWAQRFIKQWSEYGLKGRIVLFGVGQNTDENVLKGMGDEALGVITALNYSAALDTPANKKFNAAYEKRFGRNTSLYSMQGYTAARFYYEAIKAINGDVEDREKFLQALRKVEIPDDPRGPMKMDDLGNPIQNIYIRKVERVDGKLQNTVIYTYPMVSQFWTYKKEDYLKEPLYDRNYPPCRYCE